MLIRSLLMRIAVLWTMAIILVSFLPLKAKEAIGTETHSPIPAVQHRAAMRHKAGHLIAFGIASLLFTAASIKKTHQFYYLLFTATLGLIIEYVQCVLFGSAFEWWDIRDDTLAAAIGYLLGSFLTLTVPLIKETSGSACKSAK